MNARLLPAFVVIALQALPLSAADDDLRWHSDSMPYETFDRLPATRLEVGTAVIDVAFAPGEVALPRADIAAWVAARARIVAGYYGRFPVRRLRVLVIPIAGSGVRHGTSFGYRGAAIKLAVGQNATAQQLDRDWILVHEMIHLAFPSQPSQHQWIEEGLATYVEPIARAQAGNLRPEQVWGQFVRAMSQGLPAAGDQGLDRTHTWGRTYWGGALFCLLADIEIRSRTGNHYGLQDALRAIVEAGGNIEQGWPLESVLRVGDRAVGVPVLSDLYERMKAAPAAPDLEELWRRIGIAVKDGKVVYADDAPLAAARTAITAPGLQLGNDMTRK
jgi:hypothetical protein